MNTNENKNYLEIGGSGGDKLDEQELNRLLDEIPDDEATETEPKKAIEKPAVAPEFTAENKLKTIAEFNAGVVAGTFKTKDAQEFEQTNFALTLQGVAPFDRGFWKAEKSTEYRERHKGRYSLAVQRADVYWHWVNHRKELVNVCSPDYPFLREFFGSDEYSPELAEKIVTLEGNKDYSTGRANNIGADVKCKILGLSENMQRESAWLHSETVKKEKQRQEKGVSKIAKQEKENAERLRKIKVMALDVRVEVEAYKKANPLKNSLRPETEDLVNVWMAINQTGGDPSKLVKVIDAYKNMTGLELKKPALQRRIKFLEEASILKTYRVESKNVSG